MTYVAQKLRAIKLFDLAQAQRLTDPKLQRFALALIILFPEFRMLVWYVATRFLKFLHHSLCLLFGFLAKSFVYAKKTRLDAGLCPLVLSY